MSNKIPPISDSQSTVCYDADTVLISSCDLSVDSVQVMSDMKEKKEFGLDYLRCSLALLRVIFWNAEKFNPPKQTS